MAEQSSPRPTVTSRLVSVGIALAGIGLSAAAVLVPVEQPREQTGQTRLVTQALSCPIQRAGVLVRTPLGTPEVLELAGQEVRTVKPTADLVLAADGSQPSGGLLFGAGAVRAWGACQPGIADSWVILPDASDADLLLGNPDATDATVDLTLLTDKGVQPAVGTTNIIVAGRRSRVVPLSVQAPQKTPVAVRVQASKGRVAPTARIQQDKAADLAGAMTAEREVHLPGVPAGDKLDLLVANPGDVEAKVVPTAHGTRGGFIPAGNDMVKVPPHSVVRVSLGKAFAAEEGSLTLRSDERIVATAVATGRGKDFALLTSQSPQTELQLASPAGTLVLTNPGVDKATVTLGIGGREGIQLVIEPGATVTQKVSQTSIRLTSDQPVTGAVLVAGGTSVAPLQATGARTSVPAMEAAPTAR